MTKLRCVLAQSGARDCLFFQVYLEVRPGMIDIPCSLRFGLGERVGDSGFVSSFKLSRWIMMVEVVKKRRTKNSRWQC